MVQAAGTARVNMMERWERQEKHGVAMSVMPKSMLLPSAECGSEVLLQPGSGLIPIALAVAEGHADSPGLR